jgi:hypothetical protein
MGTVQESIISPFLYAIYVSPIFIWKHWQNLMMTALSSDRTLTSKHWSGDYHCLAQRLRAEGKQKDRNLSFSSSWSAEGLNKCWCQPDHLFQHNECAWGVVWLQSAMVQSSLKLNKKGQKCPSCN